MLNAMIVHLIRELSLTATNVVINAMKDKWFNLTAHAKNVLPTQGLRAPNATSAAQTSAAAPRSFCETAHAYLVPYINKHQVTKRSVYRMYALHDSGYCSTVAVMIAGPTRGLAATAKRVLYLTVAHRPC